MYEHFLLKIFITGLMLLTDILLYVLEITAKIHVFCQNLREMRLTLSSKPNSYIKLWTLPDDYNVNSLNETCEAKPPSSNCNGHNEALLAERGGTTCNFKPPTNLDVGPDIVTVQAASIQVTCHEENYTTRTFHVMFELLVETWELHYLDWGDFPPFIPHLYSEGTDGEG